MTRGETQLDRDVDLDVDVVEDPVPESSDDADGHQTRERVRAGVGRVVSGRALVLAVLAVTGGAVLVGGSLPLGLVGTLLGIFLAAFVYGTLTDASRYVELCVSGGVVAGALALVGNLALSLLGPGVPLVALGFVAGVVAGGLGHYFGRDLRAGLTREL